MIRRVRLQRMQQAIVLASSATALAVALGGCGASPVAEARVSTPVVVDGDTLALDGERVRLGVGCGGDGRRLGLVAGGDAERRERRRKKKRRKRETKRHGLLKILLKLRRS